MPTWLICPTSEAVSYTHLSPAVADESRKLIRSVSMSVETVDFDGLTKHVQEKVAELGGYIESSDTSGASLTYYGVSSRYTYLKARIPSDHLYQFVGDVESNSNVTNKSEQTTDVTLESVSYTHLIGCL